MRHHASSLAQVRQGVMSQSSQHRHALKAKLSSSQQAWVELFFQQPQLLKTWGRNMYLCMYVTSQGRRQKGHAGWVSFLRGRDFLQWRRRSQFWWWGVERKEGHRQQQNPTWIWNTQLACSVASFLPSFTAFFFAPNVWNTEKKPPLYSNRESKESKENHVDIYAVFFFISLHCASRKDFVCS